MDNLTLLQTKTCNCKSSTQQEYIRAIELNQYHYDGCSKCGRPPSPLTLIGTLWTNKSRYLKAKETILEAKKSMQLNKKDITNILKASKKLKDILNAEGV